MRFRKTEGSGRLPASVRRAAVAKPPDHTSNKARKYIIRVPRRSESSTLHRGSSTTDRTFTPTTAPASNAKRVERSPRFTRGPKGPVESGPSEAPIGHARLNDVIHADDEEKGAARPPERVPQIHHEDDDTAGRNGGLRGCYSMPPCANEEDVSASFSTSSSSSSSWRRRDPTRWRKARSEGKLRVLIEGQILTKKKMQHRR